MTDRMNGPALRDLASVVRRIADRRADVISAYEVANLEIAAQQLNRFADRIEHPVPTTDRREALRQLARDGQRMAAQQEHPSMPTREQIAEALYVSDEPERFMLNEVLDLPQCTPDWSEADVAQRDGYLRSADAVLDLLQKGGER